MNWLDIVLLCLAAIGFAKGLFDGFIKQVVSLIALVVGIFFCGKVALWLRDYLIAADIFPQETISIISYILGFLLIVGVCLLAGEVVHRVIGVTPLSILNHIAGGVFGLGVMVLFVSLALNFMELLDANSMLIKNETKIESRFYHPTKEILQTIYPNNLFSKGE